MTEDGALGADPYVDLCESVTRRASQVVAHVGGIHRTSTMGASIDLRLVASGFRPHTFSALATDLSDWATTCREGDVAVVSDFEKLLSEADIETRLSHLRVELGRATDAGARILILSAAPLSRYPAILASSILVDAFTFQIRPISHEGAVALARDFGVHEDAACQRIAEFASGHRALVELYSAVELADLSNTKKTDKAAEDELALARQCLRELGPALATWMEHWAFENGLEEIDPQDVPDTKHQALRCAGLVCKASSGRLRLLPFVRRELWIEALGTVLEEVDDPPEEWRQLAVELFSFERDVRRRLRSYFAREYGPDWAPQVLASRAGKVIELAANNTSPRVTSLSDVRSPLDWLTLNDLLAVAMEQAAPKGRKVLSHDAEQWADLSRRLVPIRNRVAHMRLAREGDWQEVRRLRRLFDMRVQVLAP